MGLYKHRAPGHQSQGEKLFHRMQNLRGDRSCSGRLLGGLSFLLFWLSFLTTSSLKGPAGFTLSLIHFPLVLLFFPKDSQDSILSSFLLTVCVLTEVRLPKGI